MCEIIKKNKKEIVSICVVFLGTTVPYIFSKLYLPDDIPANLDNIQYFLNCLSWIIFLTFTGWVIARKK